MIHADPPQYHVEIFFDGDCPLCRREINLLKRMDRDHWVLFSDIAQPEFEVAGKTFDELMDRIHGRLPDGSFIEGVEVFRRVYDAIGFRWCVAITRWPGVRNLLDLSYHFFARNRLRWTGRCTAEACSPAPDG